MTSILAEPIAFVSRPNRSFISVPLAQQNVASEPSPEVPRRSPKRAQSTRISISESPSSGRRSNQHLSLDTSFAADEQIAADMFDNEHLSDAASSICHSPSWEDYGAAEKKRKQRKKELKVAQKEAERQEKIQQKLRLKEEAHKPKRLSKAPPGQKLERSQTTPVLPLSLAETSPSVTTLSPSSTTNPTSHKLGVKPFQRSHTASVVLTPSQAEHVITGGYEGFIGGLKLQQSLGRNEPAQRIQQLSQDDQKVKTTMVPSPLLIPSANIVITNDGGDSASSTNSAASFQSMNANTHSKEYDEASYAKRILNHPGLAERLSGESITQNEGRYRRPKQRHTIVGEYSMAPRNDPVRTIRGAEAVTRDTSLRSTRGRTTKAAKFTNGLTTCPSPIESSSVNFENLQSPARNDTESYEHDSGIFDRVEIADESEKEDEETSYHRFVTSVYVAPELIFKDKWSSSMVDLALPSMEGPEDCSVRPSSIGSSPESPAMSSSGQSSFESVQEKPSIRSRSPSSIEIPQLSPATCSSRPPSIAPSKVSSGRQSMSSFRHMAKAAFSRKSMVDNSTPSPIAGDFGLDARAYVASQPSPKPRSKIERIFGEEVSSAATSNRLPTSAPPRSLGTSSISTTSVDSHTDGMSSPGTQSNSTTAIASRSQSLQTEQRMKLTASMSTQAIQTTRSGQLLSIATKTEDEYATRPTTSGSHTIPPQMNSAAKLDRKTSILKSQSTPDLSFLPELKHQSLVRPILHSAVTEIPPSRRQNSPPARKVEEEEHTKSKSSKAPTSSAYLRDARLAAPYPQRRPAPPRRLSVNSSSQVHLPQAGENPIAKMFVVCCNCKFFHDLPSKVYEAMAKGPSVVRDEALGLSGIIKTQVSCPWCQHGMSTECCAGYAGVVYLKERFH